HQSHSSPDQTRFLYLHWRVLRFWCCPCQARLVVSRLDLNLFQIWLIASKTAASRPRRTSERVTGWVSRAFATLSLKTGHGPTLNVANRLPASGARSRLPS